MRGARLVASGFGAGLLPRAPGTWGSLLAAVAGAWVLGRFGRGALAVAAVVATGAGLWAVPRAGGDADPGWVVIDEVAGMWVAMVPLRRASVVGVGAAFALFRLLDITKPGVISRVDRVPGRVGVMGDDLLAGLAAAALVWVGQRCLTR